jgi:hypothetical protein
LRQGLQDLCPHEHVGRFASTVRGNARPSIGQMNISERSPSRSIVFWALRTQLRAELGGRGTLDSVESFAKRRVNAFPGRYLDGSRETRAASDHE